MYRKWCGHFLLHESWLRMIFVGRERSRYINFEQEGPFKIFLLDNAMRYPTTISPFRRECCKKVFNSRPQERRGFGKDQMQKTMIVCFSSECTIMPVLFSPIWAQSLTCFIDDFNSSNFCYCTYNWQNRKIWI